MFDDRPTAAAITEVRHFEDPAGVEQCAITYSDGETHTFPAPWSTAREIADHACLEHRDDELGATTWTRR